MMQQAQGMAGGKELPTIFKDIQRNDLYAIKRTITANPTSLRQRNGADNRTPLHAAVLTGNPAVARELINHGATVEAVDQFGCTALHLACEQGSLAVVKELLAKPERRAVVNMQTRDGVSALHIAAQVGMRDIVMALVESGARADVRDKNGRTPMDVVNPENHPVIQMLIAAGSQASRPGPAGLMRQSSQQPVGSPMAAAKGPMAPAGPAPGSPLAVNRSMSGMAPGVAQSPRVTSSAVGLPSAAQMQSAMAAMQQAGMKHGMAPASPSAAAAQGAAASPAMNVNRTSSSQLGMQLNKSVSDMSGPLVQSEVRDLQARVAKLDAFFQAQIDLIPEWQKALGLIQNYKRMLDDHEQRIGMSDMNSKDARAKVDKLEGEMRDLRALDNQRWEVQDVAQRNLHTSIHKITLDQQQFQASLNELASHLNHLDPRRPGTLGNPNLGGNGVAELQRLRMEMDQLLRSNLMTGLDEVREQLTNNIKIQSQLAKACADLEEWRRALDADMPGALEGIKSSVAELQHEMQAGKVAELQEELVALAAQVAVLPKEQPKALADTVMHMLDSAAVCLQDHDKQLVDVRQQVASLEALLEPLGGGEAGGSGKVATVVADVQALQAQVSALMKAFDDHREASDSAQQQEREALEQRLQQLQQQASRRPSAPGAAALAGLSMEQLQAMEQQMVARLEALATAHDQLQDKVHQLEDQFMQLQVSMENMLHYASMPTSPVYAEQPGTSQDAAQQAQQYEQQGQHQQQGQYSAEEQQQYMQQQAMQDPDYAAYAAKMAAEGAQQGDEEFNIAAAHPKGKGKTYQIAQQQAQQQQAQQQQQQQHEVSQEECLKQLKEIGYAEADLMTLPPEMQQQLLAQHQQQVVPHQPNLAQPHQPKCCVIQ